MSRIRAAQVRWAELPVSIRLRHLRRLRGLLASAASELAASIARPAAETLTAEVLPLLEACRFLENEASKILAPRRTGSRGRPLWLRGTHLEVRREPLGVVLVIGPANYPLFLPGVQALQALTAGNAVILKPGLQGSNPLLAFERYLHSAGLPPFLVTVTGEDPGDAHAAIDAGVDKVVFTGSTDTGRKVLAAAARALTPCTLELSGDDSLFILPGADPELVRKAVQFGTTLNGGDTCIAPRRIVVIGSAAVPDLLIPTVHAESPEAAILDHDARGYALGAAIFGEERAARRFATRLNVGVVVINDVIVPTADPRLPFGGRGASGFGVTRGAEGLLDMTAVKAITVRRGSWRPHLEPRQPGDANLFEAYVRFVHAESFRSKLLGARDVMRALTSRRQPQ